MAVRVSPAAGARPGAGEAPCLVRDVELTEPLPALPGVREDGQRVCQAWLLVRRYTEPLDLVRVALPPAGLTPAEVADALVSVLGPDTALGPDTRDGAAAAASPYLAGRAEALAAAPPLTVVVCTRNRAESLRRTLASVRAQRYPALRMLVVDNAPADDAACRVARAAGADYLRVARPGLSRARNAAVQAAAGETLAWIDDDEVADEFWLSEVARGLAGHPDADVLCGSVVPAELETPPQVWFEELGGLVAGRGFRAAVFSPATRHRHHPDRHHPLYPLPPFGAGANMVTRPGVVERSGGFDPALGAGSPAMASEDTLFFSTLLRRGGTIVYQPRILTRHFHRRDLAGLRQQLAGYGTGLTAAYTALLRRDPAVVPSLLRLAARAVGERGRGRRSARAVGTDVPREVLRAGLRTMLRGPVAYVRGVRQARDDRADGVDRADRAGQAGPVLVALVDLDAPAPELSPHRADGPSYQEVRAIGRRQGRPVGELTLPFHGDVLRGDELSRRLAALPPCVTPAAPAGSPTLVSVVVATTFARLSTLERCVRALGAQDYPHYEVVVVDNRPAAMVDRAGREAEPADRGWLCAMPRVRVVAQPRPGASAARNRGLAEAAGDIVAFTDDDAEVDPGWLRALADRFAREPDAGCVTGLVLPAELETPAQLAFERSGSAFAPRYEPASFAGGPFTVTDRYAREPGRPASVYRLGSFGTGANMAWRAGVLRELGGFDEALGPGTPAAAGEDILLFLRLLSRGGRLAYEPGALVRHWHRRDTAELLGQVRGYGTGLTAMLTAAVLDDPRHAIGLAGLVGPAIAMLVRGEATGGLATPIALVRAKRAGMLRGPVAYLRGARGARRP